MQIVITGGAGMLGKKLAREILKRGALTGAGGTPVPVDRIVLFDNIEAPDIPRDPRVSFIAGEIFDAALVRRVIAGDTGSVFHLAAMVSAGAERDFDLGYRVNLDGTRAVLEAARALARPPCVVFASSLAVYGGADMPETIEDGQAPMPQTSYGAHKTMGELMVSDYTRKGFIDGRSLRLPTIVVRPGKPNLAASTFASSIIREPLAGREVVCPVRPDSVMPLLSPRRATAAFLHAHDLPAAAWGWNRSLMLPSHDISVGEMAEALRRLAGEDAYRLIAWRPDPAIEKIVNGWPRRLDARRACAMGFTADSSMDEIVAIYIEDDMKPVEG
ncbi:MAG: NAD-dependent epimerase/dehydratase family protein [Rhodospirillales bacterium]|nr:NAD-dependent epimerase/dehydratase family protein [Rhodospirillales bacterium]